MLHLLARNSVPKSPAKPASQAANYGSMRAEIRNIDPMLLKTACNLAGKRKTEKNFDTKSEGPVVQSKMRQSLKSSKRVNELLKGQEAESSSVFVPSNLNLRKKHTSKNLFPNQALDTLSRKTAPPTKMVKADSDVSQEKVEIPESEVQDTEFCPLTEKTGCSR